MSTGYFAYMQAYYAPKVNPDPKVSFELIPGIWVQPTVDHVADVVVIPGIIPALWVLWDNLHASVWADRARTDWGTCGTDTNLIRTKADSAVIQATCKTTSKQTNMPMKHLMHALRVAITAQPNGPSLYDAMAILGKQHCLQHLTYFCDDNG